MSIKTFTGINIQYPISRLIIEKKKTIETRTYPIPKAFLGQELALIETPGKTGKFKARAIAVIKFTECFQYKSKKEFYSQANLHCVTPDSVWAWHDGEKWGWVVEVIKILPEPVELTNQRGIVYRKGINLEI